MFCKVNQIHLVATAIHFPINQIRDFTNDITKTCLHYFVDGIQVYSSGGHGPFSHNINFSVVPWSNMAK